MKTKSLKNLPLAAASVLMLALTFNSLPLQAEQVQMYDQPPSANEMGKLLFGGSSGESEGSSGGMKMRSISFGKKAAPAPKAEAPASSESEGGSEKGGLASIGLPIKFAYNSDEILDESMPFLEEVGKMLTLEEYANKRLMIEGHTDSAGSDTYNRALSERRAMSVKHYLSKKFDIASSRLQAKGMGESKPLPGYEPEDEANRRVQFYSVN